MQNENRKDLSDFSLSNFGLNNLKIVDGFYENQLFEYYEIEAAVLRLFTSENISKLIEVAKIFDVELSEKQIIEIAKKQTAKGIATYGQTIIECNSNSYDWGVMFAEELIDMFLYSLKHNKKI